MANVGFRLGSQANADAIMSAGEGAVNGSFYLTNDSHRLYIGAPSETKANAYTLFAVNEGVETVASLAELSKLSWTADERKARAGRFYYLEKENILAIYNGNTFVQINVDTDTALRSISYGSNATETDTDTHVHIVETIEYGTNLDTVAGKLEVIADDGLKCSFEPGKLLNRQTNTYAPGKLTISGDTYSITSTITSDKKGFTLNLNSANNPDVNTSQTIKGAGGLHVSMDDDGNIILLSDDTHIQSNSLAISNVADGVKITITDSTGVNSSTAYWKPQINYGATEGGKTSVNFVNGQATLDIYTADEIQQMMKALDGMTYQGTVGKGGSFADGVELNQSTKIGSIYQNVSGGGRAEKKLSIGDTMATTDTMVIGGTSYAPGTLIIARSTDGTENPDGYIDKTKLTFDIIDAIANTDTTYKLVGLTGDQKGIKLVDRVHTTDEGVLVIEQGVAKITRRDEGGNTVQENANGLNIHIEQTNDKDGNAKITIFHESIARTDIPGAAAQDSETMTFQVIEKIKSDETGHVTEVTTKDITVTDHAHDLTSTALNTKVYSENGDTVGVITNTVKTTDKWSGNVTTKTADMVLYSSSLEIKDGDSAHGTTAGASTKNQGLSIDMVWGSF